MAEEEGKGVEEVQKPMEFEGMDFGQAQFQAGFGQPVDPDQVVPMMGDMPVPGEINGGTALDFGQAPTVEGIDIPKRPDDLQFGDRPGEVPSSELVTGTPVCLIPDCEECPFHTSPRPAGAEQTPSPGASDQPSSLDPNAKPFALLDPTAKPFDPLKPTLDPNSPPFLPTAPIFNPDVPSFDPNAKPFDPNVASFDPLIPFLDPNAPVFDPSAKPFDPNAKPFDPTAQPFVPEELVPDLGLEKQAPAEVAFGQLDATEHPKPPLGAEETEVPSDVLKLEDGAGGMKVNGDGVEKHEIEVTEKGDVNDVLKEILTESKRQEEVAALMSQPRVEDVGPDDIQAEIVDTPPQEAEEGQQQAFLSEQATIEALLGAREEPEDLMEDVSQEVTGSEEVSTPGDADLEDSVQDAEITETSDFEFVPGEEMEEEEAPKSPRQDEVNAEAAAAPEVTEQKEDHGDLPPSEEPMLVMEVEERETMEVTEVLPTGEQPVEDIGVTEEGRQTPPAVYDPFNELAEQDPLIEEGLPPELMEPSVQTGPPPTLTGFQDADFFSDLAVKEPVAEMPQEVPESQGGTSEVGPPPQEGPWGEPVAAAAPTDDIWGFGVQGMATADKVDTDTARMPEASTWDRDFQQRGMQSFAFSEQERPPQAQGWDAVFPSDDPPLEPLMAPHQAPILEEGADVAAVAGEPQPFDAVFPPDEQPPVPMADIREPTIPEEGESTSEETPTESEPSQAEQLAEEPEAPASVPDSPSSDIPAITVSEVPKVEPDDEFLVSVETASTGDIETVAMEAEVPEAAPNDITDQQIVAPPDVIADQVQVEEARQAEQVAQMAAMAAQQKWMEDVEQVVVETGRLEQEVEQIATDTAKAAEMVEEAMESVVEEETRVEAAQVATEVLERAEDKAGETEVTAEAPPAQVGVEAVPEPEAMQVEAAVPVEPVVKEEVKEEAPKAEPVAEAKPPAEPKAEEKVKKTKPAAGAAAKAKTTDKAAPKGRLPGKTDAAKPAGKDVTKRPTPPSSVSKEAPPAKKKVGAVGATKTSKAAEPAKKPSAVSEPKTKKPTRPATAPSAKPTSTAASRAAKPASAPAKTTKAPPSGAVPKTKTDRKPGAARPKPLAKAAAAGSSAEEQASVDSVEVAVDAAAALGDQVTPKPAAAAAKKPAEKKAAVPPRTRPASAAAPKAEPKTAAKKPASTLGTRTAAAKTGAAARPSSATAAAAKKEPAKKPDATTRLASARTATAEKKPGVGAARRPASATTAAAKKTTTGAASAAASATKTAAAKRVGTTGAAGKADTKATPRAQSAAAAKSAAEKKTPATPARAKSAPIAGAAKATPKAGAKAPATRPKAPATPAAKDAVMKNKVKTPSGKGAPTPGRTPGRAMQPFEQYISREAVAEGLKKGDFIKGALRINARNFEDAYVPAPDGMSDLYIPGLHARNRALNGDIVVLKVLPRSEWRTAAAAEGASPVTQLTEGMKQLALHTPEPAGAQAAADTPAGPQSPLTEGSGDAASSSGTAESTKESGSSKSSEKGPEEKNDRKKKDAVGKEKSAGAKTPTRGAAAKGAGARTPARTPDRQAGRLKPGEQTTPKGRQPPKPGSAKKTPKPAEKPGIDPTTVPEQFLQKTAKVVYIYEKKHSRACTGHLKKLDDKDKEKVLFSPMDHRLPRLKVPLEDCPPGFKERPDDHAKFLFIARITDWKEDSGFAEARLAKSLGEAGQIEPETEGLLVENGVDFSEFSEVVLQCLPQDLPWSIPAEEFENRRDLRLDCIFTIDPATARDLDDAVSCNKLDDALRIVSIAVTVQRGQRSPHSGPAGMSTPPIAVAAGRNPLSTTAVTPPHLGLRPL
ncbi:DIS3-like exonuclease 2 [Branchiostoma belcheri]|nr:DIS3-like exonuclease 2 [Branchiostoma belcheri]